MTLKLSTAFTAQWHVTTGIHNVQDDNGSQEGEPLNETSSSELDTFSWCCIEFNNDTEMKEPTSSFHMCQK